MLQTIELDSVDGRTVEKVLYTLIHFDGGHSTTLRELLDTRHFIRSGSAKRPAYAVLEDIVRWTAYENDTVNLGWNFESCLGYEIDPANNATSTIWDFVRDLLPVDDREEAKTLLTEFLETPVMLWGESDNEVQPAWLVSGVIDSVAIELTLRAAFEDFVVTEGGEQITAWDLLHRPLDTGTEPRTVEEILGLPIPVDDSEVTVADLLNLPVDVEIRNPIAISEEIEMLLDAEVQSNPSGNATPTMAISDDAPLDIVPWDVLARYYLGGEEASLDTVPTQIFDRIVKIPFSIGPDGYSIEPVSESGDNSPPGTTTLRTVFGWPVGRRDGNVVTAWNVLQSPLRVSNESWTTLERIFNAPLSVTTDHAITLRDCLDQIESDELFYRYEVDSGELFLGNVFSAPFEVKNRAIVEGDLGRLERVVPERTLYDLMETPIDLEGAQTVTFETMFDLSIEVYRDEFITIENIWIHDFRFGLRYTGAGSLELAAPFIEALKPAIVFGSDLVANNPELVLQTLLSVADFLARRRDRKSEAEEKDTDAESDESLGSKKEVSEPAADIEAVVVLGDRRIEYRGPSEGFAPTVATAEPLLTDVGVLKEIELEE